MKERVFSGTLLVIFMLAIVLFNTSFPLALNIAVALVSAVSVYEVLKAAGLERRLFVMIPSVLAATAVQFFDFQDVNLVIYGAYFACIFCAMLWNHKTVSFKDIAVAISMTVMIPLALQCIVLVRSLTTEHGIFYALIAVFSAWIPDTGAFFAGKLFGRHKLCPNISPKKTVEGLIGGVISSILIMQLAGIVYSNFFYGGTHDVSQFSLLIIGAFGSLVSVLGDLSFSLIKRSCAIKDFGNVIPGHGGILDRFDSVIFTAPFVYLVALLLPMIP